MSAHLVGGQSGHGAPALFPRRRESRVEVDLDCRPCKGDGVYSTFSFCKRLALLAISLGIALLTACGRTPTLTPTPAPTVRFRIAADGATLPLLHALTNGYSVEHANVIIALESGDPATVVTRVATGQAQLAATSLLPATLIGKPWLADLAMDGVAIVVHPQNPVNDVSLADVRAIFSGERNEWKDYGADTLGPIEVAVREDGDGTRAAFDQTVMGAQRLTLDALVMPSVETMLNFVEIKPGGIGYAPTASLTKRQPTLKALAINGKAPTPEAILSGEYPLGRMLYLLAPREPQGSLRDFVGWALGPDGKAIAVRLGYAVGN